MPLVFCSHATEDREFVEQELTPLLESQCLTVWSSGNSIRTGVDWERSIQDGLRHCDWFLVVLSPFSLTSDWVRYEVAWAVVHRPDRILPVMIADCNPADIHLALGLIQHVDYRRPGEPERRKLLTALTVGPLRELCVQDDILKWSARDNSWSSLRAGGQSPPARSGDKLRVVIRSNAPAYLYLIWLDERLSATPLHPWQNGRWDQIQESFEPAMRLFLPSDDAEVGAEVLPGSTAETLLVLARLEPLGVNISWPQLFEGLPSLEMEWGSDVRYEWRRSSQSDDSSRAVSFLTPARIEVRALALHQELRDRFKPYADVIVIHTFAVG
jgi:hypothetical protein